MKIDRGAWSVGHELSLMGLIDAACQMRFISQRWNEGRACEEALDLLNHLLAEGDIDHDTWSALKDALEENTEHIQRT